ncbi:cell division protein FtsX [Liquorilactobacillus sucicola DSM 21376 = JCM 15457]|uniref:Cell division protein FtsX n=1 Tax=Liquorilactobacillus sucicola DSM 21376 = JCM 15457 TaxID=1423806 RepID=A0A023CWG7_9LACO|nr:permease-like cell division protein FtsX [Liquorilactobacillus sucicola]KRN05965.1 cell-division associated ABC transporter, membrane FtsX subunit [Liquorilactobacillus sucicola DSM 21376 = JCM 15457]GAJ25880.1 cell division protein FtsX [Liquorilactobacillus sucicola DSM 21376 = JCM 15457]
MKAITFKRHLVESCKSLKRNGWMSVAAFSAVTVTLLLVGVLLSIIMNVNKIASDIENDVQVRVLIDRGTSQTQQAALRKKLAGLDSVRSIKFSSKERELKNVVGSYGDEFKLFGGDDNPLNDVFVVKTKNPSQTVAVAKKARGMKDVYDAKYGGASAKKLFKVVGGIQKWGTGISLLLLFVAVFLISNTIKITILSRRNEISIMRLVGATNGFIRWPFILEGAWTGLFGAILPIIVVDIGYVWVHGILSASLASTDYSLLSPGVFLFQIDALMILIGIIIGAIGSGLSMRKFLKI